LRPLFLPYSEREKIMNPQEQNLATVLDRLNRLERQNRWFKRAALVALACVVAGVGMGAARMQQPRVPVVIKAKSFQAVDDNGTVRAWLGLQTDGNPGVYIRDAKGKNGIAMWVDKAGRPVMRMFDANGQNRIGMGMTDAGTPSVTVYDANSKPRIVMGLTPKDQSVFHLHDNKGRVRAYLGQLFNDWPSLTFYDENAKVRAGIGAGLAAGYLGLFDNQNQLFFNQKYK
jgi:hypothetical protein